MLVSNGFTYQDVKEMPFRVINLLCDAIQKTKKEKTRNDLIMNAIASQGDGDAIQKTLKDLESSYDRYDMTTKEDEIKKFEKLVNNSKR